MQKLATSHFTDVLINIRDKYNNINKWCLSHYNELTRYQHYDPLTGHYTSGFIDIT